MIREDAHKKVWREATPPWPRPLRKNFFSMKPTQKLERKKLSKSVSGYYKTKKKKLHGPLRHWCRKGETLVIRQLKTTFLCVSSLTKPWNSLYAHPKGNSRKSMIIPKFPYPPIYIHTLRVIIRYCFFWRGKQPGHKSKSVVIISIWLQPPSFKIELALA